MRNKEAAAKCRRKREEIANELHEVNFLSYLDSKIFLTSLFSLFTRKLNNYETNRIN
jgi:hypothetical protein